MDLWWFLKLSGAPCVFFLTFMFFRGIATSFFDNGGNPLANVSRVIQYPLPTVLEGNQYPLTKDQWVLATLWQIRAIFKSCQFLLRNLSEGCQYPLTPYNKFANTLWPPVTNLSEVSQQPLAHLQEDCPDKIQRGNLCAIPLNKVFLT
jgi:hypothetical protein